MAKLWDRLRKRQVASGTRDDVPRERSIVAVVYDAQTITEHKLQDLTELPPLFREGAVVWVSMEGMPDENQLAQIGDLFQLQPGIATQLSKPIAGGRVEEYAEQRLISTRMFRLSGARCLEEDLHIVFGKNFVLSLQEGIAGDCFDAVRHRLHHKAGHIRQESGDHLAIALVDAVIDAYYHLLEQISTVLDTLEDDILLRHDRSAPARSHAVKRELVKFRHALWPLRDAVNAYYRDAGDEMSKHTHTMLRDCTENAARAIQMLETTRELCSDLMDLHLSTASARMNEVMKVLAIITTLFIPPTFIAGIYGMNFNPDKSPLNMPELNWWFGYPFALGLMFVMVVLLVVFLYRRGCFQREVANRKRERDELW